MSKHNYSVGPWYVTEAEGAIRIRQESSDAVLATMDDGGHPELELIPFAEQLTNARLMASAPELLAALRELQRINRKSITGSEARQVWLRANAAVAMASGEMVPA